MSQTVKPDDMSASVVKSFVAGSPEKEPLKAAADDDQHVPEEWDEGAEKNMLSAAAGSAQSSLKNLSVNRSISKMKIAEDVGVEPPSEAKAVEEKKATADDSMEVPDELAADAASPADEEDENEVPEEMEAEAEEPKAEDEQQTPAVDEDAGKAEEPPAKEAPSEEAPAEEAPVEAAPTEEAPAEEAPTQQVKFAIGLAEEDASTKAALKSAKSILVPVLVSGEGVQLANSAKKAFTNKQVFLVHLQID